MSSQKKPKRGKMSIEEKPSYFWHLDNEQFERSHWWMASTGGGRAKLNKSHAELNGGKDEKGRSVVSHAPIIWEVLRRHPKIPEIRSLLTKLVSPKLLHDQLLSQKCRQVFADYAFEMEFVLSTCGLNGWCSKTESPQSYYTVPSGSWPLDGFPKRLFQSLIDSYRHGIPPKQNLLRTVPVLDILTSAQTHASTASRIGLLDSLAFKKGDPFGVLGEDEFTLKLVFGNIESRQRDGYKIAILAYDAEPTRRSQVIAEIGKLLFRNQNSSSIKQVPPQRRPRIERLLWIYEVEQGNFANKADYIRMIDDFQFPCLPCGEDPENKDSLAQRLERIEKRLSALN